MNLDSIINLYKKKTKKRIECHLLNGPAIFITTTIAVIAVITLAIITRFSFLGEGTFQIIVPFGIVIFVYAFSWFLFRIKVTLEFVSGEPQITSKGLFTKTVVSWPFWFDISDEICIYGQYGSPVYIKLLIYNTKKSIAMYEYDYFDLRLDLVLSKIKFDFFNFHRSVGKSKGRVSDIYWTLKKYAVNPEKLLKNLKIDPLKASQSKEPKTFDNFSPFVG